MAKRRRKNGLLKELSLKPKLPTDEYHKVYRQIERKFAKLKEEMPLKEAKKTLLMELIEKGILLELYLVAFFTGLCLFSETLKLLNHLYIF